MEKLFAGRPQLPKESNKEQNSRAGWGPLVAVMVAATLSQEDLKTRYTSRHGYFAPDSHLDLC